MKTFCIAFSLFTPANVWKREGRRHNYVFIPPSGNVQQIHWRRGWINDTFIHHFNIATMHNRLQYSETELRKQISGKPKEYLFFFTLYSASSWHMATYLQQEFICRYIKKSAQGQIKLCNKTQPRRNIAGETYGTVKNYHLRRQTQNTGKYNFNTFHPKWINSLHYRVEKVGVIIAAIRVKP